MIKIYISFNDFFIPFWNFMNAIIEVYTISIYSADMCVEFSNIHKLKTISYRLL